MNADVASNGLGNPDENRFDDAVMNVDEDESSDPWQFRPKAGCRYVKVRRFPSRLCSSSIFCSPLANRFGLSRTESNRSFAIRLVLSDQLFRTRSFGQAPCSSRSRWQVWRSTLIFKTMNARLSRILFDRPVDTESSPSVPSQFTDKYVLIVDRSIDRSTRSRSF